MRRLFVVVFALIATACHQTSTTAPTWVAATSDAPTVSPSPSIASATVPNVRTMKVSAAQAAIEDADLVVNLQTKYTDKFAEGRVLSQSLKANAVVAEGTIIDLVVARALPVVINVIGKPLTKAQRDLKKIGFDVHVRKQVSTRSVGTVISQTPVGGTSALPGRTVRLTVAKAAPTSSSGGGSNSCTPGYSPCLVYHGGADYDCAGGSGDGPYYTGRVTVTGSDPYGLDADGDGVGCE